MAERDAFGNKKGDDDALADMGWSLGGSAPSVPGGTPTGVPSTPVPVPPASAPPPSVSIGGTPPAAPPAPVFRMPDASSLPQIPGVHRGGFGAGLGRMVGLLITLAVIGGIVAAVIGGVNSVSDKVRSVTNSFSIPSFTTATGTTPTPTSESPSTPSKPSAPPTGLAPGSMLRADRFGPALVKLRSKGSRAQTLRIDATRVSGNVLDASGRMTIVSVSWNGDGQVIQTPATLSGASAVSLKAVTSKAPSRAVARAAALLGRPARRVNYVVLTEFAGTAKWFVYFTDGKYVSASLDGRRVQRIG